MWLATSSGPGVDYNYANLMHWLIDEITVTVISVILTGIIIPQILLIAFRKQLFDAVDGRKIHSVPVPRLGGLSFLPAILLSVVVVLGVDALVCTSSCGALCDDEIMQELFGGEPLQRLLSVGFGLCGLLVMYLVGLADDLIGVRYRAKLVAQLIAACFLVMGGVKLQSFYGMFGVEQLPDLVAETVSVMMIMFAMNAINLIDGLDGLASGLSAIAVAFYGVVFACSGKYISAMISFASLGTMLQFFYYNVFGRSDRRTKIFMGDTGSLTVGIILACLAFNVTTVPMPFDCNPIVVASAPLAIPCMDVIRVVLHRLVHGRSIFKSDKTHIHHKLLYLGMHHRTAMMTIVAGSALLILANLLMSRYMRAEYVLLIDLLFWAALNCVLTHCIRSRQVACDGEVYV